MVAITKPKFVLTQRQTWVVLLAETCLYSHSDKLFYNEQQPKATVFLAVLRCTTLVATDRRASGALCQRGSAACNCERHASRRSKDLHSVHFVTIWASAGQPPSLCCCEGEPAGGREQAPRLIMSSDRPRTVVRRSKPRRPPERPWGPSAEHLRWRTRACGACWRLLGPCHRRKRFLPMSPSEFVRIAP